MSDTQLLASFISQHLPLLSQCPSACKLELLCGHHQPRSPRNFCFEHSGALYSSDSRLEILWAGE